MTIDLYRNLSDNRYVTKQLAEIKSADILLLENDSVDAPRVTLTLFDEYNSPNYAYISGVNKYYYIIDTEILTGGRVRYTLKCDVLMTYATEIKTTGAIISRANSVGNVLIDDKQQTYRADDILTNLAFSGCEFLRGISATNYSFLLSTFGGVNSGNI